MDSSILDTQSAVTILQLKSGGKAFVQALGFQLFFVEAFRNSANPQTVSQKFRKTDNN